MHIIKASAIKKCIKNLCLEANCNLPLDVVAALKDAHDKESGLNKLAIDQILTNQELARQANRPCCQDTGLVVVFLDIGQNVFIEGDVNEAVNQGVREGYKDYYFRKSVLTPLLRKNTKDNTPAVIHVKFIPGDEIKITLAPKGFGSENMSKLTMLTPSKGIEGVISFIVDTVKEGAANACPPVIAGVGVGGTMEQAALLAKRQLFRKIGENAKQEHIANIEKEALRRINALSIGPMGSKGVVTALGVHIEETPTHIAGLPVAVNIQCHCARHASAVLKGEPDNEYGL